MGFRAKSKNASSYIVGIQGTSSYITVHMHTYNFVLYIHYDEWKDTMSLLANSQKIVITILIK